MVKNELIISKLEGFSGIWLKDNKPLAFKPGINWLVERNEVENQVDPSFTSNERWEDEP